MHGIRESLMVDVARASPYTQRKRKLEERRRDQQHASLRTRSPADRPGTASMALRHHPEGSESPPGPGPLSEGANAPRGYIGGGGAVGSWRTGTNVGAKTRSQVSGGGCVEKKDAGGKRKREKRPGPHPPEQLGC